MSEPETHAAPGPQPKKRTLLGHKRIGHLVLVAGISASGKTSLLARLRDDPVIRARLDLPAWRPRIVNAMDLGHLPMGFIPSLVIHYDLMRPIRHGFKCYSDDPALLILREARVLHSIMLAQSVTELRQRLCARFPDPTAKARYMKFGEPGFVVGRYRKWLEYWDMLECAPSHWFLKSDEHYSLLPGRAELLSLVGGVGTSSQDDPQTT